MTQHERVMKALDLFEAGVEQEMANHPEEALQIYQQSLEISPRPIVYYRMGVVQSLLGAYDAALDSLEQALLLSPSMTLAEREKVRIQARRDIREPARAEPVMPQDRATPPPEIEEMEIGEPTEASPVEQAVLTPDQEEVAEEKPLETRPSSPEVELTLTRAYEAAQQGDLDGAIQLYQEAILVSPDDARLHYNLGNLHEQQNNLSKAYLSYQRALELNPRYGRAWNNMGYVLERLSRSEEALDCYEQAIESGQVSEAYFNAAILLEKKGRLEDALKHYRIFLEKGGAGDLAETARENIKKLERRF